MPYTDLKTDTQRRAWQNGYLEALADVLTQLNAGGEHAVREWVRNNG